MTTKEKRVIFKKLIGMTPERFLENTIGGFYDACMDFACKSINVEYKPTPIEDMMSCGYIGLKSSHCNPSILSEACR